MVKSQTIRASGIKPLNAPRTIRVRTNSTGSPTSIHVPPTINSPKARRRRRSTPPSTNRSSPEKAPMAPSIVSDGKWMQVVEIENLWKVNDEWWRGPEEEIARLYYTLRLANGQQLTVYLDLISNNWYRQAG